MEPGTFALNATVVEQKMPPEGWHFVKKCHPSGYL